MSKEVAPQLVAAMITGPKEKLRTIGWLNSTNVGISCEEEPIEWTAEDGDIICDNITDTRLSPEAVQIARLEELEFMDKPAVLKEVPIELCWSETNATPSWNEAN